LLAYVFVRPVAAGERSNPVGEVTTPRISGVFEVPFGVLGGEGRGCKRLSKS